MKTLIRFNRIVRRLRKNKIYIFPCMILSLFFIVVLNIDNNISQTTLDIDSYNELIKKDKENIVINSELETISIISKNVSVLSMPKNTNTQFETMLAIGSLKKDKEKNTETINNKEKETTTQINQNIVEETTENTKYSSTDEYIYNLINEYSDRNTRIPLTYDNVYLLSQLSWSEAGNQPFEGKVAVCEVVINRISSEYFATRNYTCIRDVIFDSGQFSVVSSGTIYNIPTDECILAAIKAIIGEKPTNGALFFLNPDIATNSWIQNNRNKAIAIGDHDFYY